MTSLNDYNTRTMNCYYLYLYTDYELESSLLVSLHRFLFTDAGLGSRLGRVHIGHRSARMGGRGCLAAFQPASLGG